MAVNSYVCLYTSYLDILSPFTDEEKGRLMTAMLTYALNGTEPTFSGNERFIWPSLRAQIDRDQIAYEAKCEKNRENGKKGGRPRKQAVPSKTEGFSEEPRKAKGKDIENEKENVNEKGTTFSPPSETEVYHYCRSSGYDIDPEKFVNYYNSIGWKVVKAPMKDWKAAVRTWNARDKKNGKTDLSPYRNIGCEL